MSETTQYTISIGNALPGQPNVTLTLPGGRVKTFFRKKKVKGEDGKFRFEQVLPETWSGVSLELDEALDIENQGYELDPSPTQQIRKEAKSERRRSSRSSSSSLI